MKVRYASSGLILLTLLLALPQPGQAPVAVAAGGVARPASAAPAARPSTSLDRRLGDVIAATVMISAYNLYLPVVRYDFSCSTGQSYGSMGNLTGNDGIPAANHPDKNLARRGYDNVDARFSRALVVYGGSHETTGPKLQTMLGRTPAFTHVYQVYDWAWGGPPSYGARGARIDPPTCPAGSCWGVTAMGFATNRGELVRLPIAGVGDIGGGIYYGLVLYATSSSITLKYSSEDSVVNGYTIHVDNVCVDPTLLATYTADNAGGRSVLPVLTWNQPFGIALGSDINVVIRDKGSFMDPRSQLDWWIP